MNMLFRLPVMIFMSIVFSMACKKESNSTTTPPVTPAALPDVFKKFNPSVQVSVDGNFVVIKSDGIPDHKSPYFNVTHSRYQAYNGTNANWAQNPNKIITQAFTFKIPISPSAATNHAATPLGPIGVSINGVPIYNQYAGPNQPLTNEINSFDQYNGHPQMTGQYHYHVEPLYITSLKGKNALIGFLLDGFPIYGPLENGTTITSANLDTYHGHVTATPDYPNGIYHYHTTADAPYINGSGFYGTAGTVTQ
jgi:hypothetical protein